jgi:hypothetical protein
MEDKITLKPEQYGAMILIYFGIGHFSGIAIFIGNIIFSIIFLFIASIFFYMGVRLHGRVREQK